MEASVATPGQGTAAAGVQAGAPAQGAAQGQSTAAGQGDGQQQGQINWGLYPDVPETQRELLEPHLRTAEGHTTKVQQQYAPYKALVDTISPEQVSNVVGFLNSYNTDPVATFLGMAQELQQAGSIPGTVNMEALQQLIQGAAPQQGQQPQAGQEDMPAWAQQIQQRLDQQDQRTQQEQQAQQTAQQEAEQAEVLDTAKTNIRGQLTQAGIGEDLVSDQVIVASIIANDGDEGAAAQMIAGLRDGFLGSFTQANTNGGAKPPNVQGQLPQPQKPSGRKGDPFGAARDGAAQFLAQQAAASG